jgi:hypothetical protein
MLIVYKILHFFFSFTVHRRDLKEFTRKTAMDNTDKVLKGAYEKALLYYDTKELPQNWDREELLGDDSEEAESEVSRVM